MPSLKVNRGRTLARSQALQILFQAEASGRTVDDVLSGDYLISKGPLNPYAEKIARGVDANRADIDLALRAVSKNWRLERMPGPDRNILRIAVYELRFQHDDPLEVGVVVNEAVEVAKAYGTDESAGFVNAVLGRIADAAVLPSPLNSPCTVTADDCEAACIAQLWFEIDPKREAERAAAAEAAKEAAYDPVAEFEQAMEARRRAGYADGTESFDRTADDGSGYDDELGYDDGPDYGDGDGYRSDHEAE